MDEPPELGDSICLSKQDLFDDGDPFTREIYDLDGAVEAVVEAHIARAFVDLNRAPDDRPPANTDGVVKSQTCHRRPIYATGEAPGPAVTSLLLERYYEPYHRRLEDAAAREGVRLALDCHSMSTTAPPIAPRPGEPRPLFCLSNRHDATCEPELLADLARAIARAYECSGDEVRLNDPFQGGYITRRHGAGAVPWIQVEMNRSWYLAPPWFDRGSLTVDPARLEELRDRFHRALTLLALLAT
jgi:formiminoglutamase